MPASEPIRVSVSEGAKLFGISQRTIRRAIKDQELTYIVVQGRYKINFESLIRWSQRRPTTRNKLANKGIGQYVDNWRINNALFSPRAPQDKSEPAPTPPPEVIV